MVMVKVPARPGLDPSRVRSDNPSGQPKGPSRVRSVRGSARRSSSPGESHPVKVRPARVSACQGFVRSPSPGQPKGRSIKVPARRRFVRSPSPGQQRAVPSRSRPVRVSIRQGFVRTTPPVSQRARQGSGPPGSRPAGVPSRESRTPSRVRSVRASACRGFVRSLPRSAKGLFHQGPGSSGARPVKGPVRPSLGSPEFLPGRAAPPLHVRVPTAPFPLSSPFMSSSSPLPLRRLLPLRRPAPPSCVPVRLSRRGRDSTAGGGIARAKMWNGISGAERRAAAASGAPLPRPPGSRPEPTPGRQTSRERGGRGIPEKEKQRAGKGFRAEGAETGEAAEPRREDRWSNAAVQR